VTKYSFLITVLLCYESAFYSYFLVLMAARVVLGAIVE